MPENVSRLTKIQYQGGGYHVCGATDSLKHSPDSANGRSAFAQCAKRFSDPVWDLKIPKWNVVVRRRYGYRFSVGPPPFHPSTSPLVQGFDTITSLDTAFQALDRAKESGPTQRTDSVSPKGMSEITWAFVHGGGSGFGQFVD